MTSLKAIKKRLEGGLHPAAIVGMEVMVGFMPLEVISYGGDHWLLGRGYNSYIFDRSGLVKLN